ncbi:MAG TPA: pilus assembly protein [Firmicutes bacterium]|nr:pilus assembly protein [Bacillota bacterium]
MNRNARRLSRLFAKSEKGQALVETALVLMLLLLLFGGIVEFGRILQASLTVTAASREGARVGILGKTDDEIKEVVKTAAGTLDPDKLQIDIAPPAADRKRGESLTVEVKYPVEIVIPIISAIIPGPFDVYGRTVMRME